jgi:hypothetical protein
MKRAIILSTLLGLSAALLSPVIAKPTKGYFSMDAMGCMLLKECTEGIDQIHSSGDLRSAYPDSNWDLVSAEFNQIMVAFGQVGVNVYLADEKYFPVGHRGVYHTVSNHFYLNKRYVHRPGVLMSVVRHEGWHAAQDCMAGGINNNFIGIIHNEEDVPQIWQDMAKDTYRSQPSAIPWEKEAFWAARTESMTQNALESCAAGTMWSDYELTPMTREWLENNGHL